MSPETATVVAAAISGVSVVTVAVVGWASARSHRHTRAELAVNTTATREVLHQVKNDHGTNLRDDLDRLAEQVTAHTDKLSEVESGQARIGSMLGSVRKTVDDVKRGQREHDTASRMIVDRLEAADRALANEIRAHHPAT